MRRGGGQVSSGGSRLWKPLLIHSISFSWPIAGQQAVLNDLNALSLSQVLRVPRVTFRNEEVKRAVEWASSSYGSLSLIWSGRPGHGSLGTISALARLQGKSSAFYFPIRYLRWHSGWKSPEDESWAATILFVSPFCFLSVLVRAHTLFLGLEYTSLWCRRQAKASIPKNCTFVANIHFPTNRDIRKKKSLYFPKLSMFSSLFLLVAEKCNLFKFQAYSATSSLNLLSYPPLKFPNFSRVCHFLPFEAS